MKLNSDPELISWSLGTGNIPGFDFKKCALVYLRGRDDEWRYLLALSPPFEVASGAATMFMLALLGGQIMGLLVGPSTLSFGTVCVSSQTSTFMDFWFLIHFRKVKLDKLGYRR